MRQQQSWKIPEDDTAFAVHYSGGLIRASQLGGWKCRSCIIWGRSILFNIPVKVIYSWAQMGWEMNKWAYRDWEMQMQWLSTASFDPLELGYDFEDVFFHSCWPFGNDCHPYLCHQIWQHREQGCYTWMVKGGPCLGTGFVAYTKTALEWRKPPLLFSFFFCFQEVPHLNICDSCSFRRRGGAGEIVMAEMDQTSTT